MVNHAWAKGATDRSPVDRIGIMVYQGTGSVDCLRNYINGSSHQGSAITVDVPPSTIVLGAGGQASAVTIEKLATTVHDQGLGGIMVWYASVIDAATGKVGNQYSGGAMDASIQSNETKSTWKKALDIMNGI